MSPLEKMNDVDFKVFQGGFNAGYNSGRKEGVEDFLKKLPLSIIRAINEHTKSIAK